MEKFPIEVSLPYDSKRDTGFVGIMEEETGGKAYLNSLLQILFHIPKFRRAVYHSPISVNAESAVLILQEIFCKLQYSNTSVSRMGLNMSKSSLETDVRTICEELEQNVKGTAEEGTIRKLFEGHYEHAISREKKSFSSLTLDVRNCNDVYASFDKYLEGNNSYHGAETGLFFTEFPPILQLHLARLHCDGNENPTVKVNTRFEYPYQLDLGRYLPGEANRSRNLYILHSVLVGCGLGGKYFVLIKPTLTDFWLKFEDQQVTRVDIKRAIDEQFGGDEEHPPFSFTKGTNAVMLIYIRESEKDSIMCNINENDIPEHVNWLKEGEEKDDKGDGDASTTKSVIIKVAIDEEQTETTRRSCSFRIQTQASFRVFEDAVAVYFGVPTHRLRLYTSQKDSSSLVRSGNSLVEQIVGDRDEVSFFLKFDEKPGATGVCELCPVRDVRSLDDFEDFGKPKTTGQPARSSARVTKRVTKHV